MQKSPLNIYMETLTERGARNTAAMLKRNGYESATIEDCRKRSPLQIAAYFEPLNEETRAQLVEQIAIAAGLKPKRGK